MRKKPLAKILIAAAYVLFILVLLEGAARTYLHVVDHIPFFANAARHIYRYYPELAFVDEQKAKNGPVDLEILMLGASVLHNPNYDAAVPIQTMLQREPALAGLKVRVYNIAISAQTTLDSYYKYEYLARKYHFDIAVAYDAINETRANNCPPEMFRPDYSHYSWYDERNFYHNHEYFFRAGTYIPYFFYLAWRRIESRFNKRMYLPVDWPPAEWMKYGADIKTAGPYRANLEKIAAIARAHKQQFLIATFAFYLPTDYSLEKWKAEKNHAPFAAPPELWGLPQNVVKGIQTHNEQSRAIAASDPSVHLLDLERIFPKSRAFFIDICHFTPDGLTLFSWIMSRKIIEIAAKTPRYTGK